MIYFIQHLESDLIRIGTTNDLNTRLNEHSRQYGEIELLGLVAGYEDFENELHHKFNHLNERNVLSGREWFRPEKDLLAYIKRYTSMAIPLPIGNRKRKSSLPNRSTVKYTTIHLSEKTTRLVRMLAGEIQFKTGKRCTDEMALQYLIRQVYPDVAQETFDKS